MAEILLSNPQVEINGVVMLTNPNTVKYITNTAENKVVSTTSGGTSVTTLHTQDISEAKSQVTITTYATKQVLGLEKQWLKDLMKNTISISDKDGGVVTESFQKMSLVKLPDGVFGADGTREYLFEGDPV